MKINKDQPNEKRNNYLCQTCYSKKINNYHSYFGRDSKAGRGVGTLYGEKREDFSALIGGC